MEKLTSRILFASYLLAVLLFGAGQTLSQQPTEPVMNVVPPTPVPSASATPSTTKMTSNDKKTFIKALPRNFKFPADDAGRVLLREYGAVFATSGGAVAPD